MSLSNLRWGEIVAALGGLVLGVSIFIQKTYEARPENAQAQIEGLRGTVSVWQVHPIMRWVLLAAAIAPIVLLWIIIRNHELSWPRGELTAVIGLTAVTLVFYFGVIDRPGSPPGQIELDWSWYTLAGGALAMAVGGAVRASESERKRKPPGVL